MFSLLDGRKEMDLVSKTFDNFFDSFFESRQASFEVWEKDGWLTVEMEAPGFSKDQITVSLEDGLLTVSADKGEETEGRRYISRSRSRTKLTRSFHLPSGLDYSRCEASYDNGVLSVRMPQDEKSKAVSIEVK
jgi:HSP20 family protein